MKLEICPYCKRPMEIEESEEPEQPKMIRVGTLSKSFGIKGFEIAEVGHVVYEERDRYKIFLKTPGQDKLLEVAFYKHSLKPSILFDEPDEPISFIARDISS